MNMMPLGAGAPGGMPAMPMPMPSPDQIEQAKLILDACSWEDVSGILRSDERRNYAVDIETDATAFEDEETEKQQRIELAKAMTEFFAFWGPAIQQNPTIKPLVKELALFTFGAFRAGRALEEAIGDAFDQIEQAPPPPNPEAEKLKAEAEMKQQEMQQSAAQMQMEAAASQRQAQLDAASAERDHQLKTAQATSDFQLKQQELAATLEFKRQELGIKAQELELKKAIAVQDAQIKQQQAAQQSEQQQYDRQTKHEEMQFQRQGAEQEREFKGHDFALRASEANHKRQDMDERRESDIKDKTERRSVEASSDKNDKVVEQQAMIAEALKGMFEKQAETQDALLAAIKSLSAPRTIKRDPKTNRAIGVEMAEAAA